MNLPGARLRTLAARVCSEKTMERFIDPTIADLQAEYSAAVRNGHAWKRRSVLVHGYIAFARVMGWYGLLGLNEARRRWDQDDQQSLARVLWRSGLTTLAFACLFEIPGMMQLPTTRIASPDARASLLIAYLAPSALVSSVPIGMLVGATLGLAGRRRSSRLSAAVLLLGLAMSAASMVGVAWIVPAANQSYREELIGGSVPKGERELTLIEIRRAAEELRRLDAEFPDGDRARLLAFAYHQRYAVASAPLMFALLSLLLAPRRRVGRMAGAVMSCALTVFIVFVSMLGSFLVRSDLLWPAIGAWIVHIAAATAVIVVAITNCSKQQCFTRTPA